MDKVAHYIYFDSIKIEVQKTLFQTIIDSFKNNGFFVRQFDDGSVTEYWVAEPNVKLDESVRMPFPPKNCFLFGYTCSITI